MARLVKHTDKQPKEIKVGGESKHICMCGLSKNKPLCDGSHRKAHDEEENKTYVYSDDARVEL